MRPLFSLGHSATGGGGGQNITHFVGYCIINCQYKEMHAIYLSILSYLSVFYQTRFTLYLDYIRVMTNVQLNF